jgi:hypothetical protein
MKARDSCADDTPRDGALSGESFLKGSACLPEIGVVKTLEDLESDLEQIESAHYYSEDFQWLSSIRAYRDSLSPDERELLSKVVLRRLLRDGSMTDILLCSVVEASGAGSILAAKLDGETVPSQLTRALISALEHYRGDDVFRAVSRFVDSDQENEALRALARIDFVRALPFVARSLQKEYLADLVLHILHDRFKAIESLERLAAELRAFSAGWPDAEFLPRVLKALRGKSEPYNPFSAEELLALERALAASA